MHTGTVCPYLYMWQSRVEMEGYSVVYFDHIAAAELPLRVGLHMRFVDSLDIHASTKRV